MSAEKCGSVVVSLPNASFVASRPTKLFSVKACRMLSKIISKYPSFDPEVEAEIWWKAYNMGLVEEE